MRQLKDSLKETERFVYEHTGRTAGSHVKPILTPRFAPTCSHKMMEGLGKIAKKYQCGLQTHLSESREEVKFALEMFPEFESDAQIYEKYGMLEYGPSIFAHVIFPNEKDFGDSEGNRKYGGTLSGCNSQYYSRTDAGGSHVGTGYQHFSGKVISAVVIMPESIIRSQGQCRPLK